MIVHTHPSFTLILGDARSSIVPSSFKPMPDGSTLFDHPPFDKIQKLANLQALVFAHQVHGSAGLTITSVEHAQATVPFIHEADFLMTNVPHVGLGILTADCLPIVFYDTKHHALALIHAGWRGAMEQIPLKALAAMQEAYGTDPHDMRIFFGASARSCCYEVTDEFPALLEAFPFADKLFQRRYGKIFFDLPRFVALQLLEHGVRREIFHVEYNVCTMCDPSFCSHRRQQASGERQVTVVSLK